jgi:hypothetical protein
VKVSQILIMFAFLTSMMTAVFFLGWVVDLPGEPPYWGRGALAGGSGSAFLWGLAWWMRWLEDGGRL